MNANSNNETINATATAIYDNAVLKLASLRYQAEQADIDVDQYWRSFDLVAAILDLESQTTGWKKLLQDVDAMLALQRDTWNRVMGRK